MCYLKINEDDSLPLFEELYLPNEPSAFLNACYDAIGCKTIQAVPTVLRGIFLLVDEEGKLRDGWHNRINKVASILYGSNWDLIVGNAILVRVKGENFVPLISDDLDRLYRHFGNW